MTTRRFDTEHEVIAHLTRRGFEREPPAPSDDVFVWRCPGSATTAHVRRQKNGRWLVETSL